MVCNKCVSAFDCLRTYAMDTHILDPSAAQGYQDSNKFNSCQDLFSFISAY